MKHEQTIMVPDIGGVSGVDVIEVLVAPGDEVDIDTPLLTLESDKASMEIPSPVSGKVSGLLVKVGDKVSEGVPILKIMADNMASSTPTPAAAPEKSAEVPTPAAPSEPKTQEKGMGTTHAGPAVRRLARELGVELASVVGTGHKTRITREDILSYFKSQMNTGGVSGVSLPSAMPEIDFSQFGPIEKKPLNKIKRLTAQQVHRSWVSIPHVTQFDEADITDLEAFRQAEMSQAQAEGHKLTLLAFVVKALTKVLLQYPQFNASLDATGESLIYKQYVNIGIAVETPNGLVVPVIKNADKLSVSEIAKEMQRLSSIAREKGLAPADMKGGSFTVSSLGGIGGTAFTPIVNAPEVAILGLSKSELKPLYQAGTWVPRLMLPLSLSYDHRVVDGAEGARFLKSMASLLNDVRRILL